MWTDTQDPAKAQVEPPALPVQAPPVPAEDPLRVGGLGDPLGCPIQRAARIPVTSGSDEGEVFSKPEHAADAIWQRHGDVLKRTPGLEALTKTHIEDLLRTRFSGAFSSVETVELELGMWDICVAAGERAVGYDPAWAGQQSAASRWAGWESDDEERHWRDFDRPDAPAPPPVPPLDQPKPGLMGPPVAPAALVDPDPDPSPTVPLGLGAIRALKRASEDRTGRPAPASTTPPPARTPKQPQPAFAPVELVDQDDHEEAALAFLDEDSDDDLLVDADFMEADVAGLMRPRNATTVSTHDGPLVMDEVTDDDTRDLPDLLPGGIPPTPTPAPPVPAVENDLQITDVDDEPRPSPSPSADEPEPEPTAPTDADALDPVQIQGLGSRGTVLLPLPTSRKLLHKLSSGAHKDYVYIHQKAEQVAGLDLFIQKLETKALTQRSAAEAQLLTRKPAEKGADPKKSADWVARKAGGVGAKLDADTSGMKTPSEMFESLSDGTLGQETRASAEASQQDTDMAASLVKLIETSEFHVAARHDALEARRKQVMGLPNAEIPEAFKSYKRLEEDARRDAAERVAYAEQWRNDLAHLRWDAKVKRNTLRLQGLLPSMTDAAILKVKETLGDLVVGTASAGLVYVEYQKDDRGVPTTKKKAIKPIWVKWFEQKAALKSRIASDASAPWLKRVSGVLDAVRTLFLEPVVRVASKLALVLTLLSPITGPAALALLAVSTFAGAIALAGKGAMLVLSTIDAAMRGVQALVMHNTNTFGARRAGTDALAANAGGRFVLDAATVAAGMAAVDVQDSINGVEADNTPVESLQGHRPDKGFNAMATLDDRLQDGPKRWSADWWIRKGATATGTTVDGAIRGPVKGANAVLSVGVMDSWDNIGWNADPNMNRTRKQLDPARLRRPAPPDGSGAVLEQFQKRRDSFFPSDALDQVPEAPTRGRMAPARDALERWTGSRISERRVPSEDNRSWTETPKAAAYVEESAVFHRAGPDLYDAYRGQGGGVDGEVARVKALFAKATKAVQGLDQERNQASVSQQDADTHLAQEEQSAEGERGETLGRLRSLSAGWDALRDSGQLVIGTTRRLSVEDVTEEDLRG